MTASVAIRDRDGANTPEIDIINSDNYVVGEDANHVTKHHDEGEGDAEEDSDQNQPTSTSLAVLCRSFFSSFMSSSFILVFLFALLLGLGVVLGVSIASSAAASTSISANYATSSKASSKSSKEPSQCALDAQRWIDEDDPAELSPEDDRYIQRFALAVLYCATDGDDWRKGGSGDAEWLIGDNECDWFGVSCNTDGMVTRLELAMSRRHIMTKMTQFIFLVAIAFRLSLVRENP